MTENKKPQAEIIEKKSLYSGFFKLDELTIRMDLFQGGTQTVKRLNFERGNAVAIMGYDPRRDEVVLINEMRPAMLARGENPFSDSLPAGMIDAGAYAMANSPDENAITAATREMEEETGLELHNPKLIHSGAFVSAGGTSEKIALVMGTIDASRAGGIHGEESEGENIKTVVVSADEFIARAEDGRLKDMKSLACAFWLAAHRDELRDKDAPEVTHPPVTETTLSAKITGRKALYEGIFNIEGLTIEQDTHDGGKMTVNRLNFERGDSVAVLGYDPARDEVLMISEMRSGMLAAGDYPFAETLPATMLGAGEDPEIAAATTVNRETGAKLKNTRVIHPGVFISSGGTSERISLIFGEVDTSAAGGIHGRVAGGENIKSFAVPADDFIARAEDGRLKDMKSLACAFWLANHREELRAAAKPAAPKAAAPKAGK